MHLFSAVRTGIEPVFPPWEGGVLTAWPTNRLLYYHSTIHSSSFSFKYFLLFFTPAFLLYSAEQEIILRVSVVPWSFVCTPFKVHSTVNTWSVPFQHWSLFALTYHHIHTLMVFHHNNCPNKNKRCKQRLFPGWAIILYNRAVRTGIEP